MADGRTVSVKLRMEIADYLAKANQAKQATGDFITELGKSKKASKELSDGMLVAGGVLAGGFLLAANASMKFEKQMSEVKAVTGAAAGEMEKLRQAALDAGNRTQYSATEAAKAEAELAKAGLNSAEILGGALDGALDLAAAGSLDLADAADIAAKAMTQFGLSGKDVGHIADMLAGGANATATDVHEMGQALKMGGGAAHMMGLSLDDTVTTLGLFTKGALVGSDAGTSLKTMLMMLANPTEKAREEMDALGFSAFDAGGNFVGMYELSRRLQSVLSGLTEEQRGAALATIFGSDAMRAANVLYEAGSQGLADVNKEIMAQADASGVAATKTDNLAGDMERLQGAIETVAIQAGSGANGGLRALVKTGTELVTLFGDLPGPVQTTITVVAALGGAGLLAAGGFLKARETVTDMLTAMRDMGPMGTKAADGLSSIAGVAGKLGLVGIAVGTIWIGMDAFSAWAEKRTGPAKANIDKLTESLQNFANTGEVAGELAAKYGDSLQKLGKDISGLRDGYAALAQVQAEADPMQDIDLGAGLVNEDSVQRVKDLDTALTNLVKSGGPTQARLALERLRDQGKLSGDQFNWLLTQLPQYSDAAKAAALANTPLAKGFGDSAANARTLAGGLREAMEAGQSLMDVFNQLNGAALSVSDAEIKAESAARALADSLDKSKGSLDITTEAGGNAQKALNDLARAGAEAATAVYNQTGSADAAAAEFEKYRQKLIDVLFQMTGNKAEAQALADKYMQMPSLAATNVELYGTANAEAQIQALKDSLNRLPGTKTITIKTKAELPPGLAMGALMRADGGTVDFFSNGGIRGRENHVADIVPAGTWRVWGEPETGGEAYIPFAESKRDRSIQVLAEANRRLGTPLTPTLVSVVNASQVPGSSAEAGAGTRYAAIDPVVLGQALRMALAGMAVTLDSARIGQVQGREGDLLRRGG